MSDYTIILILIGVAATIILTVLFIWHAFFWRSWGRVINLITGIILSGTDTVDPNKKIEPDMSLKRSEIMKAHAEVLEAEPLVPDSFEPPRARIPQEEQSQFARTTSDSGWPRKLHPDERDDPRPFRNIHIPTENETLSAESSEAENPND